MPFQSTLPVWGATEMPSMPTPWYCDFNPRSPCGERPGPRYWSPESAPISIHAPRVGSDRREHRKPPRDAISIHAPRVGSDPIKSPTALTADYFNPRSPCGERPPPGPQWSPAGSISIHAPRVGSDYIIISVLSKGANFNPRSPCGERPPALTSSVME